MEAAAGPAASPAEAEEITAVSRSPGHDSYAWLFLLKSQMHTSSVHVYICRPFMYKHFCFVKIMEKFIRLFLHTNLQAICVYCYVCTCLFAASNFEYGITIGYRL